MANIGELLKQGRVKFQEGDVFNSDLEAEILWAQDLRKSREFLHTYPREPVTQKGKEKFDNLIKRRLNGEPLAYILGYKDFYGMRFLVNRRVLVPRPETEGIVREVLASTPKEESFNIWDIGTGSGCIGISLAKILEEEDNLNKVFATDISRTALKTAMKNRQSHKAKKVEIFESNLLEYFLSNKNKFEKSLGFFNIIAANLPYLTKEQYRKSPSIQYEPKGALVATEKGLKYYKQLLEQIDKMDFSSFLLILELNPEQVPDLREMVVEKLPRSEMSVKQDLSGRDRIITITSQS